MASLCAAGGGAVVVPRGVFVTGSFSLSSHVALWLEHPQSVVYASDDPSNYHCLESITWDTGPCDYALVTAVDAQNVSIIGPGTLNGGANDPPGHLVDHYDQQLNFFIPASMHLDNTTCVSNPFNCRIKLVVFLRCQNVLLSSGLRLANSPFWTLQFGLSDTVVMRNVTIRGDRRWPNNDGCDVVSTRNVLIEDCDIATGDDAIDLSTHVEKAVTANVMVRRCRLSSTSCCQNTGMFSVADIYNVTFADNVVMDSNRGACLLPRIGSGVISNYEFRNISIETRFFSTAWWGAAEPIYITALPFNETTFFTGRIENISFLDISIRANNGIAVRSWLSSIDRVTLSRVSLSLSRFGNITRPSHDWRPTIGIDGPSPCLIDGILAEGKNTTFAIIDSIVHFEEKETYWGKCINQTDATVKTSNVKCANPGAIKRS